MKSKLAIIQDYIRQEVKEIFTNTKWDSVKENVYFEDEFDEDKEPDNKPIWFYCVISEGASGYQMEDKYIYDISFVYIYNKTYGHRDLAEVEEHLDFNLQERIKNQNQFGLWFYNLIKNGVEKIDDGTSTKTILSSSYTMRVYFN